MSMLKRLPLLAVLLGVTATFAAPATADAFPRLQVGYHIVPGLCNHEFTVTFVGGERARIAVQGDGDSDLDLYVYDENGNLIAQDLGRTDSCRVTWRPRWTGRFLVVVQNRGVSSNLYRISTN